MRKMSGGSRVMSSLSLLSPLPWSADDPRCGIKGGILDTQLPGYERCEKVSQINLEQPKKHSEETIEGTKGVRRLRTVFDEMLKTLKSVRRNIESFEEEMYY